MNTPNLYKSFAQNIAITIGRLGMFYPELFKDSVPKFLKKWSLAILDLSEEDKNDKRDAFT